MMGESKRSVTVRDVAEHAGVALSTVSRVLNNRPEVSSAMRRKVERSIAELGYEPNLLAKGLRQGISNIVGCVVRDISHPMFAEIVKGAEQELRSAGHAILVSNSNGDPGNDAEYIRLLRQRQVSGLILSLTSESDERSIGALDEFSGPVVVIDRDGSRLGASSVVSDHVSGVASAVNHMLSVGHQRVGYIGGPMDILAARERLRGYEEAHRAFGVQIDEKLVRSGSLSRDFGYEQTRQLLELPSPPTAIFAAGLQITMGVLVALTDKGVSVGDEVSLASFDDSEFLTLLKPPINAVARNTFQIGVAAARLLMEQSENQQAPRQVRLETQYIIRGSVRPPVESVR